MKTRRSSRTWLHTLVILAIIVSMFGGVFVPSSEVEAASVTVLYVNDDAAGSNDGTSWTDAFTDLQSALDGATEPGINYEIWVAAGTYTGATSFTLKNDVAIYGGFAGGETNLSQRNSYPVTNGTVLSGGGSHNVVTAPDGTDSTAVLDGFTITNGNATSGGGVLVNGSPKLSNLIVSNNSSESGGGMYVYGGSPALTDVLFKANTANIGGGMYVASDGSTTSSPTLVNVSFAGNTAAGGSLPYGGGLFVQNVSSVTMTNVTFGGNTAGLGGGMLAMGASAAVNARNSIFWGNTDASSGPLGQQQIYATLAAVTVSNTDVQGSRGANNAWTLTGVADGGSNIAADPIFADTASGDLRLMYGSGAIDKGNNALVPAGVTAGLDGNPRICNGTVDMGAYEKFFRVYVRAGAPAGGNGASWATAFTDLQSGLAAARPIAPDDLHEIWVAAGAYNPGSGLDSFTLKNAVALYGGFPAGGGSWGTRNPAANATLLDGGEVTEHVVTAPNDVTSSGILDGFTITGGNATDTGGGMLVYGSPTVSSVVFIGNSAPNGGGLSVASGSPLLVNLTFNANSADSGGAVSISGGTPTIANSVLWGNSATTGPEIFEQGGAATVMNSNVQGGWSGTGNIDSDPLFVNAAGGDLTLQAHSPAIDAGNNDLVPTGTLVNFSSQVRFRDDPGSVPNVSDCDNDPVDMGAYEYQGVSPVAWDTIYVREGATAGARSGLDWDNAFTDLESALLLAASGQEIRVAAGTYYPTCGTDRNATFWMKPDVNVYGGYPAVGGDTRDWTTNVTTLSGDLLQNDEPGDTMYSGNRSDDSYHVVRADATIESSAVLDGFTITGGNRDVSDGSGGGIYVTGTGSPTLANLIITDNMASQGGGMYVAGGAPAMSNITFSGNRAEGGPGGGGLYIDGGSPILTGVSFTGNKAADVVAGGGAICERGGSPTFTNVTIVNNSSDYSGGGMLVEQGNPKLTNVTFAGNISQVDGGGMYISYDSATLTDVAFVNNNSGNWGGGILEYACNITLTNVTFSGNNADGTGGALSVVGQPASAPPQNIPAVPGSATLTNCIVWGNTSPGAPEIHVDSSAPASASVSYSDVQGGFTGIGNIDSDPLFVSSTDVHLQGSPVASPAIDAGNNAALPAGVTTDLDGNPRIHNGTIDMGPYEYGSTTVTAPQITSDDNSTFTAGQPGSFTVTATGDPAPAITNTGSLPGGVTFTDNGDGTAFLSGTPDTGSGGVYPITITAANGVSPDAAQFFTLTVNEAPYITTQPQSVTAVEGSTATFTAAASGFPLPSVQWQSNVNDEQGFQDVMGLIEPSFSTTAETGRNGWQFRAKFTNAAGTTYSDIVTLTVTPTNTPPVAQDQSVTATAGEPKTITLVATDANPGDDLTYSIVTPPTHGTLSAVTGNQVTYTPASDYSGADYFTFSANDGTADSNVAQVSITVTVPTQAPVITSESTTIFTIGQPGSFTITTTGVPTPAISLTRPIINTSWLSFVDNGDGTATISGTAPYLTESYAFTITAANGVLPNASQSFTLHTYQAPVIEVQPQDATVVEGGTAQFDSEAYGIPWPYVSWQVNTGSGWTDYPSYGGSTTLYITGVTTAMSGNQYRAAFTSAAGTTYSNPATLTVTVATTAPQIASANSATFTVGTQGLFAVTTTGNPIPTLSQTGDLPEGMSFVDNGDGTAILGGTPAAGTGGLYPLTITAANGVLPDSTQPFTLTVNEAPCFTSNTSATFISWQENSFLITTTGNPRPTISFAPEPRPAFLTLTDHGDGTATLGGVADGAGSVTVTLLATNSAGSTQQTITLTIDEAPWFYVQPGDQTVTAGGAASFYSECYGKPFPARQWQVSTDGGAIFTDVSGATGYTLTLNNVTLVMNGYKYRLAGTNYLGTNYSSVATLTVTEPPSAPVIASPDHATFTVGATGFFTMTATGNPTPSITQAGDLPDGVSFADIGSGLAVLSGSPSDGEGGSYPLAITASNGVSPDATQTFTLIINQAPYVNTQPNSQSVMEGSSVTFSSSANGYPAPGTQWEENRGSGWTAIEGQTGSDLTLTTDLSMNGYQYRAVFRNGVGDPVASSAATLTVSPRPLYQVDISVSPNGSGVVSPNSGQYEGSNQFTATPSAGYKFKNWTVNGTTQTGNPITIDIASPTTLVANFALIDPGFEVSHPKGGETLTVQTSYRISWTELRGASTYKVRYTKNGGTTWNAITSTTGTCINWTVPNVNSNKTKCLLEVIAFDRNGKEMGRARSGSFFSIKKTASLICPNGGEVLRCGTVFDIKWETYQATRSVAQVELLLSKDGGYSYTKIKTVAGNPGSCNWTVPAVSGSKPYCLIKLVLRDKLGQIIATDQSNTFFTISKYR